MERRVRVWQSAAGRRLVAGVGICVCGALAGCTAAPPSSPPAGTVATTPPGGTASTAAGAKSSPAQWEPIALDFPAALDVDAWVWTGEELLALGSRFASEIPAPATIGGAAFNPSNGSWRSIARGAPHGISDVVWTGAVALVLAADPEPSTRGRAFVYDPKADRWWRVADPPPPAASGFHDLIWTGTEVVAPGLLAAWNPTTGTWRQIAPLPPEAIGRDFQSFPEGGAVRFVARDQQLVYDPRSDAWSTDPVPGTAPSGTIARVGDGYAALTMDLDGPAARFVIRTSISDGEGAWRSLPAPPVVPVRCGVVAREWGSRALFDVCSAFVAVDRDGQWTVLGRPGGEDYGNLALVAGDELYVFNGRDDLDVANGQPARPATLHRFRPGDLTVSPRDPPPASDAVPPAIATPGSSWRIGSATLDVPPGYQVLEDPARAHDANTDLTIALPVYPPWPAEAPCHVTTRGLGRSVDDLAAMVKRPAGNGSPRLLRIPGGTIDDKFHIVVQLSADELLDISCDKEVNPTALLNGLR